jgi:hypothetical protein
MRVWLALFFVLFLVPQKQTDRKHDPQKPAQPPAVNPTSPDASSPAVSGTQFYTYNSQQNDRAETIKIVSDILLALFTAALVYVGWEQAKTLRKHESWMEKNVEVVTQIADAAKNNADAALLNAKAVIKSERPWITASVGDDSFRLFGNPAIVPRFWLAIKNSGRTPGKLVRVLMKFEKRYSLEDLRGIGSDLFITDICVIPYVLIAPGDMPFKISTTIAGEKSITTEEASGIRDGKLFLVVYGVIEYEDIFDTPEKSHKSGFFFYYAYGSPTSHGFQTYYSALPDYLQVS